jgi:hypothetical protein
MAIWERIWLAVAALPAMATGAAPLAVGIVLALPVFVSQLVRYRRRAYAASG